MQMATILIVDDEPDKLTLDAPLNQVEGVTAKVLHPEDVERADINAADLVLVDYQLDDDNWPQRQTRPIGCQPRDGLALASILRRHVHGTERISPTAFGILSSEVAKLAFPLPAENRLHVLARLNNLEWVFEKATLGKPSRLTEQVIELANAVGQLPAKWPKNDAMEASKQLMKALGLNEDCVDHSQLLEEVTACLPPIHELSEWSHGLAIIRWMLHRILPYPCFLWDSHHLAARLRVDHRWLTDSVSSDTGLARWLKPAQYTGMLQSFAGKRWWRGRVESLLWEATKQKSFDVDEVYTAVSAQIGTDAERSTPPDHPLVCVDTNFEPLEKFSSRTECVRVRPDDWPPFADQPWTTIELATGHPSLKAIVLSEDRGKLDVTE
jgi:CheY-like chemotaxis protein